MATFGTGDLSHLPVQLSDQIVTGARSRAVTAQLSDAEPQRFGDVKIVTFNSRPRAEFVGEGSEKASTKGTFGSVTASPRKAQVTMRFNEEVQWADMDHKLGVLAELAKAAEDALARALDLGVFHRINPLTGEETEWSNFVGSTTKRVEVGDDLDLAIETAAGLVVGDGHKVSGIALDPKASWQLATARYGDGRKKHPELGIGSNVESFLGTEAAVSDTISGGEEAGDLGIRAIVGDFRDGIRWGVQRSLPLELITYGDPDGQGDLRRFNQIALRLEVVYAWYAFVDRFSIVEIPGSEG